MQLEPPVCIRVALYVRFFAVGVWGLSHEGLFLRLRISRNLSSQVSLYKLLTWLISRKRNKSKSGGRWAQAGMRVRAQEPLLLIEIPGTLFSKLIVDARDWWGVLTRVTANTSSGHFDSDIRNKSIWHSRGWCESATIFSENRSNELIFAGKKRMPTKAPASTKPGYCTGGIENSKKITKNLLFLFLNRLADMLGLKLLEL